MAEFDVDLFVIGAGSGGTRAARIAAGHGARQHRKKRRPRHSLARTPAREAAAR